MKNYSITLTKLGFPWAILKEQFPWSFEFNSFILIITLIGIEGNLPASLCKEKDKFKYLLIKLATIYINLNLGKGHFKYLVD